MPAQGVVKEPHARDFASCLETVLAIWREVLERTSAEVGADSNFFLCGGDSLDLTRVLVRVRERLGVTLDQREVGTFSTPRRMARCCADAGSGRMRAPASLAAAGGNAARPRIRQEQATNGPRSGGSPGSFVCSAGQQALWLAEQLGGGCGLYNTAGAIHFNGALQVPVLARALGSLLLRHEVLRCSLRYEPGMRRLVADVAPPRDVTLEPEPATALVRDAAALRQRLLDLASQPFDLVHGPLWRFRLLRVAADRWSLLFCLHHAVTDGWSGSVLLRNLAEAYRGLARDAAWRLPQIDTEFRRWSQRQQSASDADIVWWRDYLAGADRLASWPQTGTACWPFTMAVEADALPSYVHREVHNLARSRQLRPAALFLAALRLAVLELGGIRELCIGMPVNLRDGSAQDAAVGYFVNLLVLRERVDGADEGIAQVLAVQRALDEALRRRTAPFAELVRQLKPVPLPSGNAWCDVLFAYQNLPHVEPDFGDVQARFEPLTMPRGQHPLKVEVLCGSNGHALRVEYARECLAPGDVRTLVAAFRNQLASLLTGAARSS